MPMTDESRRSLFQQTIDSYLTRGYTVVSRERWSVTLHRKKEFNWPAFLLLAGIFYLPFYAMKKARTITISIDPDGRIHTVNGHLAIPSISEAHHEIGPAVSSLPPEARDLSDNVGITGRHEILCTLHEGGAISHIGFRDGTGMLHRLSKREAIEGIVTGRLAFFVARNGIPTNVIVTGPPGREFLKTEADSTSGNNLSSLPDCGASGHQEVGIVSGAPLQRSTGLVVTGGAPYHSTSSEDNQVYHINDDCPDGKRIEEENRGEGDDGRPLCEQCENP